MTIHKQKYRKYHLFILKLEAFGVLIYLRIMAGSMTTIDGFETINFNFIEPCVNLLHEVWFGVWLVRWWAGCPSGCQILPHRETSNISLRCTIMCWCTLIRPALCCRRKFIVPYLITINVSCFMEVNFEVT